MADPQYGVDDRFVVHARCAIRSCRAEDLEALEWFGAFRDHRAIIERTFAEAGRGDQLMWVADMFRFPVAQLWLDLRVDRLWALRVFPALQGCGIGSRLLKVAERALTARGRTRSSVAVEIDNAPALRFWLGRGYRPTERVASDLQVLEKDLTEERDARDSQDRT